MTLDLAPIKRS